MDYITISAFGLFFYSSLIRFSYCLRHPIHHLDLQQLFFSVLSLAPSLLLSWLMVLFKFYMPKTLNEQSIPI